MMKRKIFNKIFGIAIVSLLLCLVSSCTSAQIDWKNNITIDVSLDGEYENTKLLYQSVGVSFPLWYGLWASTGIWTDSFQSTGTYWGISYSFNPRILFK